MRRRRNPVDSSTLIALGVLGAGGYLLYTLWQKLPKLPTPTQAYDNTVSTVGNALFKVFGPGDTFGSSQFFTTTFEDGSTHAVGSDLVAADGTFTWTGFPSGSQPATKMQLVVDSTGNKYAITA